MKYKIYLLLFIIFKFNNINSFDKKIAEYQQHIQILRNINLEDIRRCLARLPKKELRTFTNKIKKYWALFFSSKECEIIESYCISDAQKKIYLDLLYHDMKTTLILIAITENEVKTEFERRGIPFTQSNYTTFDLVIDSIKIFFR